MSGDPALAARLDAIRERIAAACRRSGRRPEEVVLIGASKRQPAALLQSAWEAGLKVFGENRVQEAAAKKPELPPAAEWHLIGPLQSNKVKPALDLFSAVHAVDRLKIAHALEHEAAERDQEVLGFLEINLGGETTKHGFLPEGLVETVRPLAGRAHLRIVGLMAIPPPAPGAEGSRPWFRRLRELRDELAGSPGWRQFPGWLSMGMSDDFEVAIEEGASHVRVGTALFGPRPPA
ncbi:MAG TPA: YggS family pyridoxal phosphate-dependent enzyme [Thermoanaerobaculia bacterium]|nr:YggS family pyridoxal phosphate-dependent enzyme [Thermoanaerobaculia bacterium]